MKAYEVLTKMKRGNNAKAQFSAIDRNRGGKLADDKNGDKPNK